MIRVMGATKTRGPDRVWCLLWYNLPNNTHTVTVNAKVKVIINHVTIETVQIYSSQNMFN